MYSPTKTILFLARSLVYGGAERQLVVLAKGLSARGHKVIVAVFFGGGVFEPELATAGVHIVYLQKKGRWDVLPFLSRLARLLRKVRPTVLHSYLQVPNILAAALKPLLPTTRIVWGLRASNVDLSRYDRLSRIVSAVERRLSRFADCIIANSYAGERYAVAHGFPADRIVVIPNGIDTQYFRFDFEGRQRVRAAWGLTDDEVVIGLVARLDPMKDHSTFLDAASRALRKRHDLRFVCIGDGPTDYAQSLKEQAAMLGLADRIIWAGAQSNMPAVYSALDVSSSSSSFGEGFSNAIAESMACGVPCVVTDVGDSAYIVGETGIVVSAVNPLALSEGILFMAERSGHAVRDAARAAICNRFTENLLVARTSEVLNSVRTI